MIYELYMDVAAGTHDPSPQQQNVSIVSGTIAHITIQSAPESAGQLYCRLVQGNHVVLPKTGETEFRLDGTPIDMPEELEIKEKPYPCVLEGVNTDPDFSHAFTMRISLIPEATRPFMEERTQQTSMLRKFLTGV